MRGRRAASPRPTLFSLQGRGCDALAGDQQRTRSSTMIRATIPAHDPASGHGRSGFAGGAARCRPRPCPRRSRSSPAWRGTGRATRRNLQVRSFRMQNGRDRQRDMAKTKQRFGAGFRRLQSPHPVGNSACRNFRQSAAWLPSLYRPREIFSCHCRRGSGEHRDGKGHQAADGSSRSPSSSPSASTRTDGGRFRGWRSAPPRPRPSGPGSCAALSIAACAA